MCFGDVPKWSYRDALEMRLSSNRHESSNLSVSANPILAPFLGLFCTWLDGEICRLCLLYDFVIANSRTECSRVPVSFHCHPTISLRFNTNLRLRQSNFSPIFRAFLFALTESLCILHKCYFVKI